MTWKKILAGTGLFLLVAVLIVGVVVVGQKTFFQNRASSGAGTAHITVTPVSGTTLTANSITPVTFKFDTVGAPVEGVSMVQFKFTYPYSGTTPELDFTDVSGNPVNVLTLDPGITSAGGSIQFNTITRSGGLVTVTFGINFGGTTGFFSVTSVNLATAYLKANVAGTKSFTFDIDNSNIWTKGFPSTDILLTPTISYTVAPGTTPGVGTISFVPATTTINTGPTQTTQVRFNTGGTAISSLSFRFSYPYTGTTPALNVTAIDYDTNLGSDWSFPVHSITRAGNVVTVDFAAINSNVAGYTTSTDVNLATITFQANSIPTINPVVMAFTTGVTSMLSKAQPPVEILQTPTNLSYTVSTACVPTTCAAQGKNCDSISDGCGGTLNCGTCTGTQICTNNVCTAVPTSTLNFGFKVQGVTAAGITKTFAVTVSGVTNSVYSLNLTSDANGVFTATNVTIPGIGVYTIKVKVNNTLAKNLGSITLTSGANTTNNWDNTSLMVGDFDNNNIFNILDIAKMLENYTVLTTPVTTALNVYDVDNDGNYALRDIAIVLGNFTDLTLNGD